MDTDLAFEGFGQLSSFCT